MAFRIRILHATIAAFKLTWMQRQEVIKLSWLAIVLYFTVDSFFRYYSYIIDLPIDMGSPIVGVFVRKVISVIIDSIFTFGFILALYRYFILDKHSKCHIIKYTRGISSPHTVFALPWYFRFGKPELWASLLFISISMLYWLVHHGVFSSLFSFNKIILTSYIILFSSLAVIVNYLLSAIVVFAWPIIALKGVFSWKILLKAIGLIKGNIIRIAVCLGLIALPSFILEQLYFLALFGFMEVIQVPLAVEIVMQFVFMFVFFCTMAVEVALISLVYKKLAMGKA